MASHKTTIFRQLIFNIVIPTLLILLIVATYNFYNTRVLITKGNDLRNNIISKEITKILKFQDIAYSLIEGELNTRLMELSSVLVNSYFSNTDNVKNADLTSLRNKLGMDTIDEDIYIVSSKGIIINTTKKQDMNLDLFGFGEPTKNYLLGVFKSGKFDSPVFAVEQGSKRIKKYSYQPTKDKKYIIEIGVYAKKADEIIQAIEDSKNQLKNETPGILDVELFLKADYIFCMNKDVLPLENQADTLLRSFQDKRTISFIKRNGKSWYQYQYIYMERSSIKDSTGIQNNTASNLYKDSVMRIISDRTDQKALFRLEAFRFIMIFSLTMLMLSFLIYRKTKVITLPIKKLVEKVNRIKKGNLQERAEVTGNNEITTLAEQFNSMVENIELQNKTLNKQKTEIEDINAEITSSINYAKYIQSAILPGKEQLDSLLKDYFVLFKPRDIVSGDFYWVTKIENNTIIAAVDCTGHGVPGALMSMLGAAFLNETVDKEYITQPAVILRRLRKEVIRFLQQRGEYGEQKDGMDIALCSIDYENMKLQFAGANNPLYLVRDSTRTKLDFENQLSNDEYNLYEVKGDRMPVGIHDKMENFTLYEIDILKGDILYLFSDGFADQFGGPERKKFQYINFKKLLLKYCTRSMEEQKLNISKALEDWQGNNDQIDDILVIGIKII